MTRSWALVTGSAQRIGAEIARSLAARGFNLHLHANTSGERLDTLAEELEDQYSIEVRKYLVDFADVAAVGSFVAVLRQEGPHPVLVVNNASVWGQVGYTVPADIDVLVNVLTINTAVPVALATMMVGVPDSHVINLTDGHVNLTCPHHLSYDISKAALADATRRLAVLLGPQVRVNGIGPGLTLPPIGEDAAYLQALAARSPLQRPSSVTDVVAALHFLLDTPSITGQVVMVDSGEHLMCDGEALPHTGKSSADDTSKTRYSGPPE